MIHSGVVAGHTVRCGGLVCVREREEGKAAHGETKTVDEETGYEHTTRPCS